MELLTCSLRHAIFMKIFHSSAVHVAQKRKNLTLSGQQKQRKGTSKKPTFIKINNKKSNESGFSRSDTTTANRPLSKQENRKFARYLQ